VFLENSRYFDVKTVEAEDSTGRKVTAVKLRRLPFAAGTPTVPAGNDRLDVMAQRKYTDGTKFWHIADANTELGNYRDAVAATQWMLNIRPGNVAGLTRAAYQRELHGQIAGAIELMQMAYDATPYQEFEDRAWLLTQMAHLNLLAGDLRKAEMLAKGALGLYPGYHYALGTLAQLRLAQGRYDDAVALLETRYAAAPHAENLYALADALDRAAQSGAEPAK